MSDEQIDTTELVDMLSAIAQMDEETLARSSSPQLDSWLANLSKWYDLVVPIRHRLIRAL